MGEVEEKFQPVVYEDLEELKALFPFVLFGVYSIGYAYLKTFYGAFGIAFENYINVTDIVFFAISPLLFFAISYLLLELFILLVFDLGAVVWIKIFKKSKSPIYFHANLFLWRRFNRPVYNNLVLFILLVYLGGFFLSLFWPIFSGISSKMAVILPAVLLKVSLVSIKKLVAYSGEKIDLSNKEKTSGVLYLALIVGIVSAYFQAKSNSRDIMDGLPKKEIAFFQGDILILTEDNKSIFIGETSGYIFIYNKNSGSSTAYSKGEIKEIHFSN